MNCLKAILFLTAPYAAIANSLRTIICLLFSFACALLPAISRGTASPPKGLPIKDRWLIHAALSCAAVSCVLYLADQSPTLASSTA